MTSAGVRVVDGHPEEGVKYRIGSKNGESNGTR